MIRFHKYKRDRESNDISSFFFFFYNLIISFTKTTSLLIRVSLKLSVRILLFFNKRKYFKICQIDFLLYNIYIYTYALEQKFNQRVYIHTHGKPMLHIPLQVLRRFTSQQKISFLLLSLSLLSYVV